MSRSNPWLYGAAIVSAAIWAVVALTGVKLGDLYVNRGAHGFRHVVVARLDLKINRLAALVSGTNLGV